jgi:hypothetical protein
MANNAVSLTPRRGTQTAWKTALSMNAASSRITTSAVAPRNPAKRKKRTHIQYKSVRDKGNSNTRWCVERKKSGEDLAWFCRFFSQYDPSLSSVLYTTMNFVDTHRASIGTSKVFIWPTTAVGVLDISNEDDDEGSVEATLVSLASNRASPKDIIDSFEAFCKTRDASRMSVPFGAWCDKTRLSDENLMVVRDVTQLLNFDTVRDIELLTYGRADALLDVFRHASMRTPAVDRYEFDTKKEAEVFQRTTWSHPLNAIVPSMLMLGNCEWKAFPNKSGRGGRRSDSLRLKEGIAGRSSNNFIELAGGRDVDGRNGISMMQQQRQKECQEFNLFVDRIGIPSMRESTLSAMEQVFLRKPELDLPNPRALTKLVSGELATCCVLSEDLQYPFRAWIRMFFSSFGTEEDIGDVFRYTTMYERRMLLRCMGKTSVERYHKGQPYNFEYDLLLLQYAAAVYLRAVQQAERVDDEGLYNTLYLPIVKDIAERTAKDACYIIPNNIRYIQQILARIVRRRAFQNITTPNIALSRLIQGTYGDGAGDVAKATAIEEWKSNSYLSDFCFAASQPSQNPNDIFEYKDFGIVVEEYYDKKLSTFQPYTFNNNSVRFHTYKEDQGDDSEKTGVIVAVHRDFAAMAHAELVLSKDNVVVDVENGVAHIPKQTIMLASFFHTYGQPKDQAQQQDIEDDVKTYLVRLLHESLVLQHNLPFIFPGVGYNPPPPVRILALNSGKTLAVVGDAREYIFMYIPQESDDGYEVYPDIAWVVRDEEEIEDAEMRDEEEEDEDHVDRDEIGSESSQGDDDPTPIVIFGSTWKPAETGAMSTRKGATADSLEAQFLDRHTGTLRIDWSRVLQHRPLKATKDLPLMDKLKTNNPDMRVRIAICDIRSVHQAYNVKLTAEEQKQFETMPTKYFEDNSTLHDVILTPFKASEVSNNDFQILYLFERLRRESHGIGVLRLKADDLAKICGFKAKTGGLLATSQPSEKLVKNEIRRMIANKVRCIWMPGCDVFDRPFDSPTQPWLNSIQPTQWLKGLLMAEKAANGVITFYPNVYKSAIFLQKQIWMQLPMTKSSFIPSVFRSPSTVVDKKKDIPDASAFVCVKPGFGTKDMTAVRLASTDESRPLKAPTNTAAKQECMVWQKWYTTKQPMHECVFRTYVDVTGKFPVFIRQLKRQFNIDDVTQTAKVWMIGSRRIPNPASVLSVEVARYLMQNNLVGSGICPIVRVDCFVDSDTKKVYVHNIVTNLNMDTGETASVVEVGFEVESIARRCAKDGCSQMLEQLSWMLVGEEKTDEEKDEDEVEDRLMKFDDDEEDNDDDKRTLDEQGYVVTNDSDDDADDDENADNDDIKADALEDEELLKNTPAEAEKAMKRDGVRYASMYRAEADEPIMLFHGFSLMKKGAGSSSTEIRQHLEKVYSPLFVDGVLHDIRHGLVLGIDFLDKHIDIHSVVQKLKPQVVQRTSKLYAADVQSAIGDDKKYTYGLVEEQLGTEAFRRMVQQVINVIQSNRGDYRVQMTDHKAHKLVVALVKSAHRDIRSPEMLIEGMRVVQEYIRNKEEEVTIGQIEKILYSEQAQAFYEALEKDHKNYLLTVFSKNEMSAEEVVDLLQKTRIVGPHGDDNYSALWYEDIPENATYGSVVKQWGIPAFRTEVVSKIADLLANAPFPLLPDEFNVDL